MNDATQLNLERDLVLVMTASIDPKAMAAAATAADPLEREQTYAEALRYYLTEHPRVRQIVFAENSNWPLDRLRRVVAESSSGKEVELLSFDLNDFPRHLGKSYGELRLLDGVFDQSQLVRKSSHVAKITGRNCLRNMTRLLERTRASLDFMTDLRDHKLYDLMGLRRKGYCGRHGESRFFVVTPAFYREHFYGRYPKLDDSAGYMLENLIFDVTKATLGDRRYHVMPRFPIEPEFSGVAGHWHKDYSSVRERTKRRIRSVGRRVTPWLWI